MESGIYAIICRGNQKLYIGSAKNFKNRWRAHLKLLRRNKHHSPRLQHSWNKYGGNGFIFIVVEHIDDLTQLIPKEQEHLDSYDKNFLLNAQLIAGNGGNLGRKASPETRRKQSLARRGKPAPWNSIPKTEAQKQSLRDKLRGRVFSEEHKAKIRETLRLRKEQGLTQSRHWVGKQHSDETLEKMRAARREWHARKRAALA